MPIGFKCPGCGKAYRLAENLAGKKVKCGCGTSVVVPKPKPAAPAPQPVDELQPLSGLDNSLFNDALPPVDGGLGGAGFPDLGLGAGPSFPAPVAAAPLAHMQNPTAASTPAPKKKKTKGGKRDWKPILIIGGCVAAGIAAVTLVIVAIVTLSRPGFSSPEAVFAAYQDSLQKKNWQNLLATLDPGSQTRMTELAVLHSMPRAQESAAIRQVMTDHSGHTVNLPAPINDEAGSEEDYEKLSAQFKEARAKMEAEQKQIVSGIKDKPAFFAALSAAIEADQNEKMPRNPLLKTLAKKPAGEFRRMLASSQMNNLKVQGDKASGVIPLIIAEEKVDAPIEFTRDSGRWYLYVADAEAFVSDPVGETFLIPLSGF
jgi:hypothetical protein